MGKIAEVSPRWRARIAGFLYLICGIAYTFVDNSVLAKVTVQGDATATAHNILARQPLYWRGFGAGLISVVMYVAVTMMLYELFRPVNRNVSLTAAVFSLIGCTIQAAATILYLAPMTILNGGYKTSAFTPEQLHTLATMSLNLRAQVASIYMVLFGIYCLMLGYLIVRSRFMPRILGVFMAIAGLSYQVYLSPPLGSRLFKSVVFPAGMLGEMSLILWLLIVGVNSNKWMEQANGVNAQRDMNPARAASTSG